MRLSGIEKHRSHGPVRVPRSHLLHGRGRKRTIRSSIRAKLDDEQAAAPQILQVHSLSCFELLDWKIGGAPPGVKWMIFKLLEFSQFGLQIKDGIVITVGR